MGWFVRLLLRSHTDVRARRRGSAVDDAQPINHFLFTGPAAWPANVGGLSLGRVGMTTGLAFFGFFASLFPR